MRVLLLLIVQAALAVAAEPSIASFTAAPPAGSPASSITMTTPDCAGGCTLSWSVTPATTGSTTCSLDSGRGTAFRSVSCTASTTVTPSSTAIYTLFALNSTGSGNDQALKQAQITVVIGANSISAITTTTVGCDLRGF